MPGLLFRMKQRVGSHYARVDGKIVELKAGDEVRCEKRLLRHAMDKFEQVEPDPPDPQPNVGLRAVHRGHGNWDVINEVTGQAINTGALTKKEALEMASKATATTPPEDKEKEGGEDEKKEDKENKEDEQDPEDRETDSRDQQPPGSTNDQEE